MHSTATGIASAQHLDSSNAGSRSSVGVSSDGGPKPDTFCMRSRWWLRPTIITLYAMFLLIAVPLLTYNSIKDGFTRDDQLILIGGLFVLAGLPMSVWHIVQHMSHFTKPVLQKHIVRILWMVPIYSMNAWLGLIFYEHSFYMDCMREIYEAYVIYNFMVYLLNYLNLEMDLERSLEDKPQQPHYFPLCCMQPWRMGRDFVHNCKHGILQYAVLRLFTTLIAM